MIDPEVTRLSRLVALLTLLQTKRVMTASELALRFSVSTRTIYRDIRTLETAGIPVVTHEGKGYAMLEGYRLPPVMFTKEEAVALLTAEKLAIRFTDPLTAQRSGSAMDKVRAALRHAERDHLETLAPHIQVLEPAKEAGVTNAYQQLVTAVGARQVVQIEYSAAETGVLTSREIEPIGLYFSNHWHLVAYCRLRQEFRDFRLDRIHQLKAGDETFSGRPHSLQQYWVEQANRKGKEKVIIHVQPDALLPALARHLQDTKHQYGWIQEQSLTDGRTEMLFLIGSLPYLATWLLPFAGAVTVAEPIALREQLRKLAQKAYDSFCT
jgi:predicted DNA-binding transcriptional regulator YafY